MWESKSPRLKESDIHPQELLTIALTKHSPTRRINTRDIYSNTDINNALLKLNDRLCMWERATSREVTLIIVPHSGYECVLISQSGKPLSPNFDMSPEELLAFALKMRTR